MQNSQNSPGSWAFFAPLLGSVSLLAGCTAIVSGEALPSRGTGVEATPHGGATALPSGAAGSGTGGASAVTPMVAPFAPAEPALPRLTSAQYRNVITDLFGADVAVPELEADQRPYSFSIIGASTTTVSEHGVDLYSQAAFKIARSVFSDATRRQKLVGCTPATPLDDVCLTQFLQQLGARAWRRSVTPDELTRYGALADSLGREQPWTALEYVTAAILQSPSFLYRVELGEPDAEKPGWRRYSSYEMASRLSFLLRNSLPDSELFAAAASGELATREGVRTQVTRLLDATGATETMLRALYAEYLDLPLLDQVEFPTAADPNKTLANSMKNEVLELVSRIGLRESGDMRTLFSTRSTSINAELANLYGVSGPSGSTASTVELSADGPRAGILTTGALLTLNNRPNRTSPTIRGLFVRQRLLCGSVPPPPPGIPPIMEDDAGPPKTIREKLEKHRSNPTCAACHQFMDPIGLGMEDFDQYGRFRSIYETGQVVDAGGDVDGKTFTGARQLGELLAQDPRVTACLVKQIYRYGSARLEAASEEATLEELNEGFAAHGYQLRPLLLELTTSDGFRYTVGEAP